MSGLLVPGSEAEGAAAGFHGEGEFDCHFCVGDCTSGCVYVGGDLSFEVENSRVWIPVWFGL